MGKTFVSGKEKYSLAEKKELGELVEKYKFEVLPEDFVRKVKDSQLVAVGRSHVNYVFEISMRPCLYYHHFFMNSFDYKDFSSNDNIFQ